MRKPLIFLKSSVLFHFFLDTEGDFWYNRKKYARREPGGVFSTFLNNLWKGLTKLQTKVSIVMPVYNGGSLMQQMLDSLCRQTFKDFELIVVDDGSTDDTALNLARYAEKEPRLRPFTVPNGGPARARNFGIGKAKGEYLYLCDADDLPEPNLLESLVREMDKGAELAACGFVEERETEGKVTASSVFTAPAVSCKNHGEFLKALPALMEKQLMHVNWNKMYRMDIIRRENIAFIEKYASCEDRLFNLAYFPFVEKFTFLPDVLFHYYLRGSSLTSKFLPSKYESLECFDRTLNGLYENSGALTDEVRAVNARIFVKGAVACLISLRQPTCKLTGTEKKAFIREMLQSRSLENALSHLSGGVQFKVIGLLLKTGSVSLARLLGWAADFAGRRLPGLLHKLKHRS